MSSTGTFLLQIPRMALDGSNGQLPVATVIVRDFSLVKRTPALFACFDTYLELPHRPDAGNDDGVVEYG
jgi:hypothetical protein